MYYFYQFVSEVLHIVSFESFVKSMMSCLSELKVTSSFCFPFKIPDDVTATIEYVDFWPKIKLILSSSLQNLPTQIAIMYVRSRTFIWLLGIKGATYGF
jgi:hypothetical protein